MATALRFYNRKVVCMIMKFTPPPCPLMVAVHSLFLLLFTLGCFIVHLNSNSPTQVILASICFMRASVWFTCLSIIKAFSLWLNANYHKICLHLKQVLYFIVLIWSKLNIWNLRSADIKPIKDDEMKCTNWMNHFTNCRYNMASHRAQRAKQSSAPQVISMCDINREVSDSVWIAQMCFLLF